MKRLLLAAGLIGSMTGCSVQIRTITANAMTKQGVYVGYWEGTCQPVIGCGIGDGKATFCTVNADNGLSCSEQTEVSALLARKPATEK